MLQTILAAVEKDRRLLSRDEEGKFYYLENVINTNHVHLSEALDSV